MENKDTIIPVKFFKKLTAEQIEVFVDCLTNFTEKTGIECQPISQHAVVKRYEKNKPQDPEIDYFSRYRR